MTIEVIHLLEVIEVEAQHGEGLAACLRLLQRAIESLSDIGAIGEPGEWIVMRKTPDRLFRLSPLLQIANGIDLVRAQSGLIRLTDNLDGDRLARRGGHQ